MESNRRSALYRFIRSCRGKNLIALMLIASIQLCTVFQIIDAYRREQGIATRIRALGGQVAWDDLSPPWIPQTIRSKTRLFHRLAGVHVYPGVDLPPDLLAQIGTTKHLRFLDIGDRPLTDADLVNLEGLVSLRQLQIHSSKVTDAGLEHLKNLTNLEKLWLGSTQVSDTGMERLSRLTNLNRLILDHTRVTDSGLERLKGLTKLRDLALEVTKTTEEGRRMMREALPKCVVRPLPPR